MGIPVKESELTGEQLLKRCSPKDQLFIHEFMLCNNATEALRRLGKKGTTAKDPSKAAHKIMRKPEVKAAIAKLRQEINESKHMQLDEMLMILSETIRFNPGDYLLEDGSIDYPAIRSFEAKHRIDAVKVEKKWDDKGNPIVECEIKANRHQSAALYSKLRGWDKQQQDNNNPIIVNVLPLKHFEDPSNQQVQLLGTADAKAD